MSVQRWFPVVAFLTMVAFCPLWEGGALATRWGVIAIGTPLLLLLCDLRLTPLHYAGGALLLWGLVTMLWTPVAATGVGEFAKWALLATTFLVAAEVEDLRWTYIAIIAGVAISGGVAIAQSLGFSAVPQLNTPAGLFVNRNYLAEIATATLILTIGLRQWIFLPFILSAAFLPHSRGAFLGLLFAGLVWLYFWSRTTLLCVIALLLILLVVPLPHMIADSSSLLERVGVWLATIQHLTLFGHGIGSFFVEYPTFMPHPVLLQARPAHAHNEILNALSDLGIPGLLCLGIFGGLALRFAAPMERLVLVSLLGIGMFSFPLHVPATGFLFAVVAGSAAHRWRLVRGSELHSRTAYNYGKDDLGRSVRHRKKRASNRPAHIPA